MEAEPEDETEAGEISMPKPGRVQPGAEMRMASQPRLEEVIRAPPPRQAESSDSSSGSSGQREARKRGSPDSEGDSPRRRHSRKRKKRSLRHSPDQADISREQIKSHGRHKHKASSRKRRRRSPSSEESHGSLEVNRQNGSTDKKQHISAHSLEDESNDSDRQRRKDAKDKKAKKKRARSSRHEHSQRRSDHRYVLCSLYLSLQFPT